MTSSHCLEMATKKRFETLTLTHVQNGTEKKVDLVNKDRLHKMHSI